MTIDINTIKVIADLISAVTVIAGFVFAIASGYSKLKKQSKDIEDMKKENTLVCFALQACLDGLEQLGANHTVPVAKEKLEKHLNINAHK